MNNYKFAGVFADFPNFKTTCINRLQARGKEYIIKDGTRRPANAHLNAPQGQKDSRDKAIREYKGDCEIALSIISGLLDAGPLARVQFIINDGYRSNREKCVDILAQLELEFVPPTDITSNIYKTAVESIPAIDPLCSKSEAARHIEHTMTVMTTQSSLLELHHYRSRYQQADLIRIFYSKTAHDVLESYKTLQILNSSNGQNYTFASLCREVRAQLISKGFSSDDKQSKPANINNFPVHAFSADTSSSIQASVAAARSPIPSSDKFNRPCFNCQGLHKNSDCPAAHCRNCNKFFRSITDPSYHHFTSCSLKPVAIKRGNAPAPNSAPPRSFGYDRPNFKKANTAVDTVEHDDTTVWHCNFDDQSDDDNLYCNMVTEMLPSLSLPVSSHPLNPDAILAMVDSGTNVKVCSYELPRRLKIPIQAYSKRKIILFGNQSRSYSTHFAYFGVLIGNVSLLKNASDFLLSVEHFTSKLVMVLFREDKVYFLDQDFRIITSGNNTVFSSRLYYVDILPLINFNPNDATSQVNSRKALSVTQQEVQEVMSLHKRLDHASRVIDHL